MNKKKKQVTTRNVVWNKHYENVLEGRFSNQFLKYAEELFSELNKDSRISYCIFSVERGKDQNKQSFHFQGYLEFNTKVDLSAFNKKYQIFGELRKGTQQQAIDYVKKEQSKLTDKIFEFGSLKGKNSLKPFISLYDINDPEIPSSQRQQEVLIDQRLSKNEYKNFEDLKKSFSHIYIKQESWLRNLWNKYHPIEQLNIKPARVIWLFSADGKGGVGKTIWTRKYIRMKGYSNSDVASVSPQNQTYSDKVYFTSEQEHCKVLVINEVDKSFPKHNNLISFIDRNTFLITKGSHIRNNFELIIINSVYKPELVFSYLGEQIASQIIRRIYNPAFGSKVYSVLKNQKQLDFVIKEKKIFSDKEFQDWYQPFVKEIKEPDYSLIYLKTFKGKTLSENRIGNVEEKKKSSFLSRFKKFFTNWRKS